ncbi:hypothetical protein MPH_04495 [Macrophomina phaseolina MS6]|uniref:Uncharacterized protein n=1 Tax=Macrophomina phaseolina (strain MS6) TaxID=1126212 RepID=K2SN68_MACPH|nr:hypothetical protein MPH_04495 [Macrophomina phaseolina MS6]
MSEFSGDTAGREFSGRKFGKSSLSGLQVNPVLTRVEVGSRTMLPWTFIARGKSGNDPRSIRWGRWAGSLRCLRCRSIGIRRGFGRRGSSCLWIVSAAGFPTKVEGLLLQEFNYLFRALVGRENWIVEPDDFPMVDQQRNALDQAHISPFEHGQTQGFAKLEFLITQEVIAQT